LKPGSIDILKEGGMFENYKIDNNTDVINYF
jgi:hypothetical protein